VRGKPNWESAAGIVIAVATLAALLGAAAEWLAMGQVHFSIVSLCIVLAMLFVLHRAQSKNNLAIDAKLDALIARERARGRVNNPPAATSDESTASPG
jgi:heme O synthase-like polyprenyltransferase